MLIRVARSGSLAVVGLAAIPVGIAVLLATLSGCSGPAPGSSPTTCVTGDSRLQYDYRSRSCIIPTDDDAQRLYVYNQLRRLASANDRRVSAQIEPQTLLTPRDTSDILASIPTATVASVGFYIPSVSGGINVSATIDGSAARQSLAIAEQQAAEKLFALFGAQDPVMVENARAALMSAEYVVTSLTIEATPHELYLLWERFDSLIKYVLPISTDPWSDDVESGTGR